MKSRLGILLAGLAGFLLGSLVMYVFMKRNTTAVGERAQVASDIPQASQEAPALEGEGVRESREVASPTSTVQATDPARMVFGSTRDEEGGAAPGISLALATLGDPPQSARSDRDGAFVFAVQKPGRFKLTAVECPGYVPASISVEIRPEDSSVHADLRLKRVQAIPVRLLDGKGDAFWMSYKGALSIGPAIVVCSRKPLALGDSDLRPAVSISGLASFRVLDAGPPALRYAQRVGFIGILEPHVAPPYVASVVCRSQVWASLEVNEFPEELVFRVDLDAVSPLGSIRARFIDEKTGKSVDALNTGAFLPGQPGSVTRLVADAQGYLTYMGLPPGRLILLVSQSPLERLTLPVDVTAGVCTDLGDIILRSERNDGRRGVVLDENGTPIPDLEVRIEHLDPKGEPSGMFSQRFTDSTGTFRYALHLPGGLVHLHDTEWVTTPVRCEYTAPVDVPIEVHASRGVPCRLAAGGSVEESWGVQMRDAFGLIAFEGTVRGGFDALSMLAPGHYELVVMTPEGAVSKQPLEVGASGVRVELPR